MNGLEGLSERDRSMIIVPEREKEDDDGGILEWLFEALGGDFVEGRTGWQILLDTVISMIPVVDQICDARDILANIMFLTDEDEANDTMAWVGVGLCGIGLFPTAGSAAKGALKIVFKYADEAADIVFPHIRKLLKVDPEDFLRKIEWDKFRKEVPELLREMMNRINKFLTCGYIPSKYKQPALKLKAKIDKIILKLDNKVDEAINYLKKCVDDILGKTDNVYVTPEGIPIRLTDDMTKEVGSNIHKFEIDDNGVSKTVKNTDNFKDSGKVHRHLDESGNIIRNELIPAGYSSTDELIQAVKKDPNLAKQMGYSSPEALEETIKNVDKYLNTDPIQRKAIQNSKLAGETKSIVKNGKTYDIKFDELGFPDLKNSDAFIKGGEVDLIKDCGLKSEDLRKMTGTSHMEKASEFLQKKIDAGEIDLKKLLKEQGYSDKKIKIVMDSISEGKGSLDKILTWHHHQETGKMLLVRYDVHNAIGHTGGNSLWGMGIH